MKDSFVMRTETKVSIDRMSDAEAGRLFKAILAHVAGETIDESAEPISVQLMLPLITGQIDRADEKYQRTCERRAEAGRKGGEAKAENARLANASNAKQSQANDGNALHTEPDPEPEGNIKRKGTTYPKEKVVNRFPEAWDAYPRKQGRKEAEAAYLRAVRDGTTHDQIMAGIEAYKQYLARNQTEARYIKQGSTFFRQGGWNDDWSGGKAKGTDYMAQLRAVDYSKLLRKGTG